MTSNKNDFYDKRESMPREERQEYLNIKLREAVRRAYTNSTATRNMLDKAGIKPDDIRTVKDLEKVPVTRKTDVIELQKANPPYGGFLSIPPEEVERVFISPGPIYEPLHTANIKWFARAFYAAGFRKGDIVINTFTYHLSPAGVLFHEALRDCGATVVVTGTGNTEIQIQTMIDLKVTGFVGTPSFLMTIIKKAEEMGHVFNRDLCMKRAWFTGEMLSPSVRRTLEEEYGIATSQGYAVTEPGGAIAYECAQKSGMHIMDDYVLEIVDPETGKQLGPGETGEIVVTPLHNPAWGLIRFGTGDLSSYTTESCPCGRTACKITGIIGRAGDAIKVRGMFVVTRQAEEILGDFESISKFQIVITRPEQRDEMTLRIEITNDSIDRESLSDTINRKFQSRCRVKIDKFEFLKPGGIREDEPVITDKRVWE